MKSAEIRSSFLEYFRSQGHTLVPSSSLVPAADPTLLFVNSGMVQFKDVFLGREKRPYTRAVTSQRSLRAGGKHNDLENVGYTARHHTFFEMLGNFSFGDYFKKDAIRFAWELLTKIYGLPAERLWITVYQTDDEAYDVWTKGIRVPGERCIRVGDKPGGHKYQSDNFWQMADTGPCGPCSEIFYDHGPGIEGGPPGSPEAEGDRYVEIWNLVFMQFNRDDKGVLHPLPKPSVDTGMGLERIATVLQGKHSNYDIDLFQDLIRAAARETGQKQLKNPSLNVIADHVRACSFLIVDGVIPGNEGRGYVLRRIIRRAIRHGYKLGQKRPFFHRIVEDLDKAMGDAYPELRNDRQRVAGVLRQEEERFAETLENGMSVLESALASGEKLLDGDTVFRLYDTFGFPVDLTADICRERGVRIDMAGFEAAMDGQRERGRAASRFSMAAGLEYSGGKTEFRGYETLAARGKVLALYREGTPVAELGTGETGVVVLDRTPFYAESGGQVGDRGELAGPAGSFAVEDTQKIQAEVFGHRGTQKTGVLRAGEEAGAQVDAVSRRRTMWNHSATHLMHSALRRVLGKHVQQRGSLVDAERTRFDFSHTQPMTEDEIRKVEALVNGAIQRNYEVTARIMKYEEAIRAGALAFFGDKYGDEVRVLSMGDFSTELCGGTHVARTGDIGFFKIVSESGVAAGVRRVEALTGEGALAWVQQQEAKLAEAAAVLKAPVGEVSAKIAQVLDNARSLERELARLKSRLASSQGEDLAAQAVEVKGTKVLAAALEGADARTLRETMDQLKERLKSAAIVLGAVSDGKVALVAGVTPDLTARVKAGELVNYVAQQVGGRGGGRPDMAQAGGTDAAKLPAALRSVSSWVSERL
ncbi:MAG: alanine--tRNA ligase [Betaproteobacteria bacterium RIFCSPHIGHO2_12_FULL_69_13]|nr:MAG: alanine--tRNA ligase [Betaproteobacteria bacterium RIFCSPHIGHO2_12_FULL_69_13]OGA66218.1 MAG: alanine--tRNA ligase [Betaproteobacteria bacterium RIFCSPLOWO2_12_FULL_68_20]